MDKRPGVQIDSTKQGTYSSTDHRTILIKKGKIVNADSTVQADILIEDGKIVDIKPNIDPGNAFVIDALGYLVIPGGIDPHTHLDFEFMGTKTIDNFYTGTQAAVYGGTTTVIDFIAPKPGETLISAHERYKKKAEDAVCDYGFHMIIREWKESLAKDMQEITKCHINSFKVFMAYKNDLMVSDDEMHEIFSHCRTLGALPMVHAENGEMIDEAVKTILSKGITGPEGHTMSRPPEVEAEATDRACTIAKTVGSPLYVVHVMTDESANMIGKHKKDSKLPIFGETLGASLGSDGAPEGCSFQVGAMHVMSPPICLDPNNKLKMMEHLTNGTLSVTGSDNCTFTCQQKESLGKTNFTKIPNGVNGVEDRMGIVWHFGVNKKLLSLQDFVAVTSTNAAKIFNIYPKKGAIAVGSDADVVIWNPIARRTISSKTHKQACDFNIFEGMEILGGPKYVIVKGKICRNDMELNIEKGFGKFVPTPCFSKMVYKDKEAFIA